MMKITAISVITEPHPWDNGDKLLALFSCEYAGLRFHDCQLVRGSRTHSLLARPPKGQTRMGERAVRIIDPDIRDAMAAAAYAAFVALGGTEEQAA